MHVFFKDFFILHSFCSSLFIFQLSVHMDRGGVVKQKVDREREGLKIGKMCGHPLWMTRCLEFVEFTNVV